jgi:DNA polymerase (family 10)
MSTGTKRPYIGIFPIAQQIVNKLEPYCERIEIAGSLRRGREMIGDIELVALPVRPPQQQPSLFAPSEPDLKGETKLDAFLNSKIEQFRLNGRKLKSFRYAGIQVDLFLPLPSDWGWRLLLSTGSGEFNKWLVTQQTRGGAMPFGMSSKDGSLWRNGEKIETWDEAAAFEALNLPWIPPHFREVGQWQTFIDSLKEKS